MLSYKDGLDMVDYAVTTCSILVQCLGAYGRLVMAVACSIIHLSHTKVAPTFISMLMWGLHLQTYKTSDDATGAACLPDDTSRNKLLIAGIVLACVLLLALLLAVIMFWR